MTPIIIRTKDRPHYLHTTLKSLTATELDNSPITIIDDCSTDKIMIDYLFTDKLIKLNDFTWYDEIKKQVKTKGSAVCNAPRKSNKQIWNDYIGNIPNETNVFGLKNRFEIIQPDKTKGPVGGLMYAIDKGFKLYNNEEKIIVIEDDLIFNKNWLKIAEYIYNREKNNDLGIIQVYNREIKNNNNLYMKRKIMSGQMYLIPRKVYDLMKQDNLFIDYPIKPGSDVFFQSYLREKKHLNLLNSCRSFIQHIGIKSICRPGRFLRYSVNFVKPYAWNENFDFI